jgi:Large polyvalent protein associated domain 29
MSTKEYLTCAETAKLVRSALKTAFPGTKFGVRSKTYSGGASITVSWTDGPTSADVDKVISLYSGASFDGMIDLKSYHDSILVDENGDARVVHFGADYVFTSRKISAEWRKRLRFEVEHYVGHEVNDSTLLPVSTFRGDNGGVGLAKNDHRGEYADTLVHQLASLRDRRRLCDHRHGTYGMGNGLHRCCGCGMVCSTWKEGA